jgi:tryptophanyl-tRNA synthetase
VDIYAALAGIDAASVLRAHGGRGFGPFKEALAEVLVTRLAPIARETRRLVADEGY